MDFDALKNQAKDLIVDQIEEQAKEHFAGQDQEIDSLAEMAKSFNFGGDPAQPPAEHQQPPAAENAPAEQPPAQ
ncbi:MAG: hypothetical protein JO100_11240 [Pseudonocardia sp.]|nr:hypothetical protein [Pseudonocardia sp.]